MGNRDGTGTRVRHACAVSVSSEHLWELSARYIADGIASGEQVVYFEDGTAERVLDRLSDDGVCPTAAMAAGQLTVGSGETTRAVLSGPVERLEEALHHTIDDGLARGFAHVRVTGEPGRALLRSGGVGLVEYELGLRRVLDARPEVSVLCLYDQQRFPPELVRQLRGMHEHEVPGTSVYDDGLLRITRTHVGGVRLAGEADHSNRGILDRLLDTLLDETLRSAAAPTEVTVDVSSLRFLDVAGATTFVRAADRFPSTHRLVLRGIRPRVHRVLERCGAPFAPQLELAARTEHVLPDPSARRS